MSSEIIRITYNDIDYTESLMCPITRNILTDPVMASDGWTYERNALEELLGTSSPISPKTGEILKTDVIIPNLSIQMLLAGCRIHQMECAEIG